MVSPVTPVLLMSPFADARQPDSRCGERRENHYAGAAGLPGIRLFQFLSVNMDAGK
jgi:hypothetical protein